MDGSRDEVMRFMPKVISEFRIPDERTQASKMQDWAVNLAWDGAPVVEHVHSEACNLREADRTRRRSMNPPVHVSRHSTSVARVNDGSAGGSARSHNDD